MIAIIVVAILAILLIGLVLKIIKFAIIIGVCVAIVLFAHKTFGKKQIR